ncbi:MAG: hypothetical protein AMJ90_09235 [candidate division Zixibacteria bacterium SM23_73_2]|nr:MAG: hypothetical protein AMJ90_09235 [candidate division Zixibacteria bacterium SM23_73_2]
MAKKRVYQIAKEYKVSSEAMLSILRKLGFKIKSHMSVVDDDMASAVEKKFQQEKEAVKKEYAWKKRKKKEREQKEELQRKIEKIRSKLKAKDTERRPGPGKTERPRGRRTKFKKPKRTFDEKTVEKSVKKTLAQIETIKKTKKYKKKTSKDLGIEQPSDVIQISEYATVAELAGLMEVKPAEVITKLMELGVIASMNQRLDMDTIQTVALEFGYNVEEVKEVGIKGEEEIEEEEKLSPRAPVITIMGHVDHGKTSLLDYIRKSNIIGGESGGITQHIGAYEVNTPKGKITFLDTPGHEAFTAMRARGAQITDIVVLLVAVDDGVMPQTVEAIDHAKAAGVPIIVAINKMDLPGADPEMIKNQLSKQGLVPEEWGGKAIMVGISAKIGTGVDKLLEMILLQAEMMELKANPNRLARGVVVESRIDRGRGPIATVLIQKGTLRNGDSFVTGISHGKIRAMLDERGRKLSSVVPSQPVLILGASGVPQAGDSFMVTKTEQESKELSLKRMRIHREKELRRKKLVSLLNLKEQASEEGIKELKLIIKADVVGSIEALSDSLEKLSIPDLKVNIIHKGTGAINESDVLLAAASQAIIIGFHVRPDMRAKEAAQREKVDIRLYNVIYEVEKEIKAALEGMLEPETKEVIIGTAEVRDIFRIPKIGQVAGCYVQEGNLTRGDRVRVIRDGVVIYDTILSSLRRFKDDVKEVASGFECGAKVENFEDLKQNDSLETYQVVEIARKTEEA